MTPEKQLAEIQKQAKGAGLEGPFDVTHENGAKLRLYLADGEPYSMADETGKIVWMRRTAGVVV